MIDTAKPLNDHEFIASESNEARLKETSNWRILALEGLMIDLVEFISITLYQYKGGLVNDRIKAFNTIMKNRNKVEKMYGENLIKPFIWTLTAGRSIGSDGHSSTPADNSHFIGFSAHTTNSLVVYLNSISHQTQGDMSKELVGARRPYFKNCDTFASP